MKLIDYTLQLVEQTKGQSLHKTHKKETKIAAIITNANSEETHYRKGLIRVGDSHKTRFGEILVPIHPKCYRSPCLLKKKLNK